MKETYIYIAFNIRFYIILHSAFNDGYIVVIKGKNEGFNINVDA